MVNTYNFRVDEYLSASDPRVTVGTYKDNRNGIVCVNPTLDIEMYINYLRYLNSNIDKWKTFKYIDMGMMPLVMGPSFYQDILCRAVLQCMNNIPVEVYQMPAISQFYYKCPIKGIDLWAFREDIARVMNVSADTLRSEDFIRWLFKYEIN